VPLVYLFVYFYNFEGFDFLAEYEEFDVVVKTIMDVGSVSLEYLCWLFGVESGGSAVALGKQICTILCKQAKERKFSTKSFTTTSFGDSITSRHDEILELELRHGDGKAVGGD
jgi:hypothetical protein